MIFLRKKKNGAKINQNNSLLKNALKILNINNKNITFQLVENKYKKLVKKYHPDKNKGDKKYEEKLKKINQAFGEIKEQLVTKLN